MTTCQGTTKKGAPCTKSAKLDGYCSQHADQAQPVTEAQEVPKHLLTRLMDKATRQRPGRTSAGDQGGRAIRLAISRRGRRPKASSGHQTGLSHRGSLSAYRTSSRESRDRHAAARASLDSYRTWVSPKNRAFNSK